MPLNPDYLLSLPPRITTHCYTTRDTMLYALGVGAGAASEDLRYTYEDQLEVLPTMAVVLAYPGFWQKEPQYGIDWKQVLHGGQSLVIHQRLPAEGEVRGELVIEQILDKGPGKGALLKSRRDIFESGSQRLLATVRQVSFLRGDGGCGGGNNPMPEPYPIPSTPPDAQLSMPTRPDQALLYRLSGDYNPLHADPDVARQAGLPKPILHGLCSYGIAGRALARLLCDNQASRLRRIDCRFTAPVFPGETLRVSVWHEGAGKAAFQAIVEEREKSVLGHGYVEFEEV